MRLLWTVPACSAIVGVVQKGVAAGLSSLGARMALFVGPALWILQCVAAKWVKEFYCARINRRSVDRMFIRLDRPPALPALLSAVAAPMDSESVQVTARWRSLGGRARPCSVVHVCAADAFGDFGARQGCGRVGR